MKIVSLLVPACLPAPYVGATPTPYQSGTVDRFERELAKMSPLVIRHANSTRLHEDAAGRFAHVQIVTRYDLLVDPAHETAGNAVALALKTFGLDKLAVILGDDAEDMDAGAAADLAAGLHIWNSLEEDFRSED